VHSGLVCADVFGGLVVLGGADVVLEPSPSVVQSVSATTAKNAHASSRTSPVGDSHNVFLISQRQESRQGQGCGDRAPRVLEVTSGASSGAGRLAS
jgi:hypothetical protein